jgi:hypothetical protein
MVIRWNAAARQIAVGLALSCGVIGGTNAAGVERPAAILQSASGTPAIFELSNGGLRSASIVGIGRRYELPVEIETHAGDAATFLLPDSVIEVSANTLMRIVAPDDNDAAVVQRVLQQTGSSLFRVRAGSVEHFQVKTPFLVTVVNGAVFNVVVRNDGATVSLQEGHLQVNSPDASQTVELAPGDVAFAGRDGELRMLELQLTSSGVAGAVSPLLGHQN